MRITPIEIRQKTFERQSFGGYNKQDVNNFLLLLSQEWEKIHDENKELKIRIDILEKENAKLKEVENSLFKTLKTAEDTSTNMIDQARKTAELKIREAQLKSDAILNDARSQAKMIVQNAQMRAKNVLDELLQEMKEKERDYKDLENHRINIIHELKNFLQEIQEKVNKFDMRVPRTYMEEQIQRVQELIEEQNQKIDLNQYEPTIDLATENTPTSEYKTDSFFED
ncbi:MAG: DivIVA domain-containing protein [Microscillaceae bacterium]|nr:DivIVA domain-containing protein [Microscillaceae bacterium]MDW8460019.1 DivIVA domain-containing protein [Cytophagales bacterium]